MGVNFDNFRKTNGSDKGLFAKQDTAERKTAQVWLNIGYETGDEDKPFVSLPQGIALDTQEHVKTNSSNDDYAAFQGAKNDFLDQLMELAAQLEPGQSTLINVQVEMRRVSGERAEIAPDQNKFVRKLNLLGNPAE